jgi:uncharacterized protein (DUF1501 family)
VTGCRDDYAAARRRLGVSDDGPSALTRRKFLGGALAGAGLAFFASAGLPRRLTALAEAATPLAPGQGILVVILLGGGNDGFNMVVPASNAAYYAARGPVAVAADKVLPIDSDFGFHPSLPKLAARYQAGQVAAVMGVGYPNPDLSHFTSMANWMSGQPGTSPARPTGWLGRWLDGVGNADALAAVAIDDSVPLHMVGMTTTATALPTSLDSAFGAKASDETDRAMFSALAEFGARPTGIGSWADAVAGNAARSMELAGQVAPLYKPALPSADLATQLALVARLINANFGIRAFAVEWNGDFDVHSDEVGRYAGLMTSLDNGIDTFYSALDPQWGGATSLMTFSEFGRRVHANDSGTDHGTASTLLVVGDQVRGGLLGEPPSLSALDDDGNAVMTTDYRSVYATVLSDWLQGDPDAVLGASFPALPLFRGAPTGGGGAGAGPTSGAGPVGTGGTAGAPARSAPRPGYWLAAADGAVFGFGRGVAFPPGHAGAPAVGLASTPDHQGGWLVRANGRVVAAGTARHHGDLARRKLGAPVVALAATPSGAGYWLAAADGSVFAFGDAAPHGGHPTHGVVAMAATPSGRGYWLVTAKGAVSAHGDAARHGAPTARHGGGAVVALAATPSGAGYWLAAADGAVLSFGDAAGHGSALGHHLLHPIVSLAATPSGQGYWLVGANGGVFTYGDAPFRGGLAGSPPRHPVVAIAT